MTSEQRRALKARGGPEYLAVLERERAARALFRKRHPEAVKFSRKEAKRRAQERERSFEVLKAWLCKKARARGRKAGRCATIKHTELIWPTHCPVLGITLDYSGNRDPQNPARPSLDRWDNAKGYEPGNVFVISFRANMLKSNGSWRELAAVARYAEVGL